MKSLVAVCLMVIVSLPAVAVEDSQVMYVGGTSPGVNAGVVGRLDTASEAALIFEYSGSKLVIPYDVIRSFEYSKEVKRHLGVLPAIAVGLLTKRRHRHFFRISYRDPNNVAQAAVFEVPKQMPRTIAGCPGDAGSANLQGIPPMCGAELTAMQEFSPCPAVTLWKLSQNHHRI